ncbi:MAG: hypothetical protein R3D33_09145 [Hyphomicrobiaceae bacterium]
MVFDSATAVPDSPLSWWQVALMALAERLTLTLPGVWATYSCRDREIRHRPQQSQYEFRGLNDTSRSKLLV